MPSAETKETEKKLMNLYLVSCNTYTLKYDNTVEKIRKYIEDNLTDKEMSVKASDLEIQFIFKEEAKRDAFYEKFGSEIVGGCKLNIVAIAEE